MSVWCATCARLIVIYQLLCPIYWRAWKTKQLKHSIVHSHKIAWLIVIGSHWHTHTQSQTHKHTQNAQQDTSLQKLEMTCQRSPRRWSAFHLRIRLRSSSVLSLRQTATNRSRHVTLESSWSNDCSFGRRVVHLSDGMLPTTSNVTLAKLWIYNIHLFISCVWWMYVCNL